MRFKIAWEGKRNLVQMSCSLGDYYRQLVECWNSVIDSRGGWPSDGRTKEYKSLARFADYLIHLHDLIAQTESENQKMLMEKDEIIRQLRWELRKWTDQQRGRKPKLSEEQRKQILEIKAQGHSNRALGKIFNVSERTVRRAVSDVEASGIT